MTRIDPARQWQLLTEMATAAQAGGQPAPMFQAADAALGEAIGHKLFTLMTLNEATGEAERIYTNQPEAYPVSGRKQMVDTPWYRQVIAARQHYLGPTMDDIRWAFYDHELIASLGCGSVINLLVFYDGAVLGSANLLHEEHYYGQDDVTIGAPFAQLLAPAFLQAIGRA